MLDLLQATWFNTFEALHNPKFDSIRKTHTSYLAETSHADDPSFADLNASGGGGGFAPAHRLLVNDEQGSVVDDVDRYLSSGLGARLDFDADAAVRDASTVCVRACVLNAH